MTRESLETWLSDYQLNPEQTVLANLALTLASEFDAKPHTSTAAELRKTVLEISRLLKTNDVEVDPLAALLSE